MTDNFLRMGGDSVSAVRMIAAARNNNLLLTFADVFQTECLRDLALVTTPQHKPANSKEDTISPCTLLDQKATHDSIREEVARICGVEPAQVEDVFPCTPLQQEMLAMTAK